MVLETRDLDKLALGPDGERTLLKRVDLKLRHHEILGVLGPDREALRTLMNVLSGHDFPTAGNVMMDGKPVYGPCPDRGILDVDFPPDPSLTVRANVMATLAARGHPQSHAEHVGRQLVNMVGLKKYGDAYSYDIAQPMQLRLNLALALAMDARAILMVEPFAGMMEADRAQWERDLLHVWRRRQVSIVFAGGDLEAAVYLADRLLILDETGATVEAVEVPLRRPRTRDQWHNPRFMATLRHLERLA